MLGDARLTIASVPDGTYDVLVVDALELRQYPDAPAYPRGAGTGLAEADTCGSLLFHISSRTLDLRPVIGSVGR